MELLPSTGSLDTRVNFEAVYTFGMLQQKLGLDLDLSPRRSVGECKLLDLLEYIEEDRDRWPLLTKPRLSNLIEMKWNEEKPMLILNAILYSFAWASLNGYMIAVDYMQELGLTILILWILTVIAIAFLLGREILQIVASSRSYLLNFRNWPKFALVFLGLWLVCDVLLKYQDLHPLVILLSAWGLVLTICLWPPMFVPLWYFEKVVPVILKIFVLFGVVLVGFVLVFCWFKKNGGKCYLALDRSIHKTFIMLMEEFNTANASLENNTLTGYLVLFLFIVMCVLCGSTIGWAISNIGQGFKTSELHKLIGLFSMIRWIRYVQNIRLGIRTISRKICCWRN